MKADKAAASIPFGYTETWHQSDKYQVKTGPSKPSIRLGVIGLGGVAQGKHLPAIARLRARGEAVVIAAGAEVNEDVRRKVQEEHGFTCYADYREMLEREELDAVEVLTDPGESRLAVLRDVIDRGLHALVEKPFLFLGVDRLQETISLAREMISLAESKDLVVTTGFAKRFSPPYRVAKEVIRAGDLGEPSMIAVKMCQGWSRHILLEGQACHLLDMTRNLMGELKGLHAFGINRFSEPNYPYDNIVVNAEFDSGAIGTFYFSSSNPSLKPWERVEVFGNRRWLVVEDGISTTVYDSEDGPAKTWAPVLPHTLFFDEEFGGFAPEIANFLAAIRRETEPVVTAKDGLAALVLAQMIHVSIRERRYVTRQEIQQATTSNVRQGGQSR